MGKVSNRKSRFSAEREECLWEAFRSHGVGHGQIRIVHEDAQRNVRAINAKFANDATEGFMVSLDDERPVGFNSYGYNICSKSVA